MTPIKFLAVPLLTLACACAGEGEGTKRPPPNYTPDLSREWEIMEDCHRVTVSGRMPVAINLLHNKTAYSLAVDYIHGHLSGDTYIAVVRALSLGPAYANAALCTVMKTQQGV